LSGVRFISQDVKGYLFDNRCKLIESLPRDPSLEILSNYSAVIGPQIFDKEIQNSRKTAALCIGTPQRLVEAGITLNLSNVEAPCEAPKESLRDARSFKDSMV
jgi:hypothetical protein